MGNNFFTICSLFYSVMLVVIYFGREKIKNLETKIYSKLVTFNFLNVVCAVLSYFTIMGKDYLPFLNDFVSKLLLLLFISWELIFTLYVISITRKEDKKNEIFNNKKHNILFLPLYTIIVVVLAILPLNYYNVNNIVYSYGPAANFIYALTAILIVIWVVLIIRNYTVLKSRKCIPVILLIVITLIVVVIQKLVPGLLLITATETFITFMMYHTIENPDVKMLNKLYSSKEISDNANEEKAMFIYNMTNEIRNITKEIEKSADNILEEISNKKANMDIIGYNAREIKSINAKFLNNTIDILDISSVDSRSIKVYNDKYSIKILLKQLIQKYSTKCKENGIDFQTNITTNISQYLYGDEINLKEVLTLLLDNSLEVTTSYIGLTVNTIKKNDIIRLIIEIEDNSKGNNAKDVDDKIKDEKNVIYKAKELITLIGGTLIYKNDYSIGNNIKIVLDQKEVNEISSMTKYNNLYYKKKILLVDDNEASCKIISKLLNNTDIELDIVYKGSECLEKIRNKEKYDLILLDEVMEPLDGITVLKKLKDINGFNIDVILLTRDNNYEYNDEYLKYGFCDYILKPIDKNKLMEKIDKYLND